MSDQQTVVEEEAVAAEEPAVEQTEEPTAEDSTPAEAEAPAKEAETASSEETQPKATETNGAGSDIHNLKSRQQLTGKVKNITPFGAFVDVGLAQDGLVHISELARQKVEKVEDVVSVGQEVDVWVKKVDTKRGRISLTMIKPIKLRLRDIEEESELEGTVTRLEAYGAFIDIDSERDGLVHISQITHDYINHPEDALSVGDTVNVKVLKVNRKKRQVDLSIKALLPPPVVQTPEPEPTPERVEEEALEEEPIPTAMAIAFASIQEQDSQADNDEDSKVSKEKSKRKKEQDDIISRTLAAS